VDRLNDLIRSGGEWISSVRIENALMCHPAVAEAAVVAVVDVRWQERPLACIVLRTGAEPPSPEELLADLRAHVPSWWLPDRVVFLDALPHTATGKFDKKELRARFSPRPAT
jgi:fatty-acyl-CoA synthase